MCKIIPFPVQRRIYRPPVKKLSRFNEAKLERIALKALALVLQQK